MHLTLASSRFVGVAPVISKAAASCLVRCGVSYRARVPIHSGRRNLGTAGGAGRREFDLVVFGSTGFTGTEACKYIAQVYGMPSEKFKYAIAGRDAGRLARVESIMVKTAAEAAEQSGGDGPEVKITVEKIMASAEDEVSVIDMCRRARCVVNYLSPPSVVSGVVVAACAANGTHYVDVAGELDWVARMHECHHTTAVQNGAKIVPCSGLAHVGNDMAMLSLSNEAINRGYDLHNADVTQFMEVTTSGISGGSLRTFMEVFRRTSLKSFLGGSYRMCRSRQADNASIKFVWPMVKYNAAIRRWTGLSFMGPTSEAYIRWSNEIQSFVWGKELKFRVLDMSNNMFGAVCSTAAYYGVPVAFTIMSRFPGLTRIFPPTGKATFNYDRSNKTDNYGARIVTHATFPNVTRSTGLEKSVIDCSLEARGEMYNLTCRASVEAAMTCLFGQTPPTCGVVSPSAALGNAYISRLSKCGVDIKVSK